MTKTSISYNTVQDFSEMSSIRRRLVRQRSRSAHKGIVTSGSDNHKCLSSLDSRRSIGIDSAVLVDCQRLTSDGQLINLQETVLGNQSTVGRQNGSLLSLENITRGHSRGIYFYNMAVSQNDGQESKHLFQFVDKTRPEIPG